MIRSTILALTLAGVAACSSKLPVVPPVTPTETGTHHVGKFVWYDLVTHDVDAAERFYGQLFGWQFHDDDQDRRYITIVHNGRPIGGLARVEREAATDNVAQWVSWLSVADVDRATQQVEEAGGAVLRDPREAPNRGRFALVSDPQGALVALLRSSTGDPPDLDDFAAHEWLWTELWTRDVAAAFAFYQTLADYEREVTDAGLQRPYTLLMKGERARAGVAQLTWDDVRPHWIPYVKVDDPAAVASRVESLGGTLVFAPDPEVRKGSVAIIQDPTGGVLAIQKWPYEEEEEGGADR